jgi:hypothetical protein
VLTSSIRRPQLTGRFSSASAVFQALKSSPECKFFLWTVLLGRVWAAARRVCHGLQDDDTCALCSQATETSAHLLASCVYTREFWFLILRRLGLRAVIPTADVVDVVDWWLPSRKRAPKDRRKSFDTLFMLGSWMLWLDRNARVYGSSSPRQRPRDLFGKFQEEAAAWSAAGFVVLTDVVQ